MTSGVHAGSGVPQSLLFERLEGAGPAEPALSAHAGRAAIEASIAREIGALLATRIDPSVDGIDPRERTVLDYGLPDVTGMVARSTADQDRIARAIERAIAAFEPRLASPEVSIVPDLTDRDRITFVIAGMLNVGLVPEPYAFAMEVGRDGAVHGL